MRKIFKYLKFFAQKRLKNKKSNKSAFYTCPIFKFSLFGKSSFPFLTKDVFINNSLF